MRRLPGCLSSVPAGEPCGLRAAGGGAGPSCAILSFSTRSTNAPHTPLIPHTHTHTHTHTHPAGEWNSTPVAIKLLLGEDGQVAGTPTQPSPMILKLEEVRGRCLVLAQILIW